jgi:hypothetical protein
MALAGFKKGETIGATADSSHMLSMGPAMFLPGIDRAGGVTVYRELDGRCACTSVNRRGFVSEYVRENTS